MGELESGLAAFGMYPVTAVELAGDASRRRFFRVTLASGGTVVAAVYPAALAGAARADHAVQVWGDRHGLPIPRPLGWSGLVVASEDLGDEDLEKAMARGASVVEPALDALAAFQRCEWSDLPTPPFDAAFFRRELAVFEAHALPTELRAHRGVRRFLDELAEGVARHPYRLVHRDFHLNNLLLVDGRVRAVDYQDMRGGPDTYDVASLLRERGGAALPDQAGTLARAAASFGWEPGWERRYLECAAQRGLKVTGTFLTLAAAGRPSYLRWLAAVCAQTEEALRALGAPEELGRALPTPPGGGGL